MRRFLADRYFSATLGRPAVTLAAIVVLVAALGAFVGRVELDASAESLVLENDRSLGYYREIRERYGSDDFVVVTYAPDAPLFSAPVLRRIKSLRDDLAALENVASVTSLLDVPLLRSPPVTFSDVQQNTRTLLSAGTDIDLAREEFTHSPLYANLLVGEAGRTAGLYVFFRQDARYQALRKERDALRERRSLGKLGPDERARLDEVSRQFKSRNARQSAQGRADIAAIRGILGKYRDRATIHLAGVPMVVADMVRFILHDLRAFGAGVLCFIVALLALAFRRPRWIAMPLLICAGCAIGMLGVLGLVAWPLTVVSSNFLSVLLIVTLSLTIHLIVRFQELHRRHSAAGVRELIEMTVRDKFVPCLYTAGTTIVAFGSLALSGIRPVIDFGWMMVAGVVFSFALVFTVFPAFLVLLPATEPAAPRHGLAGRITRLLGGLAHRRAAPTLAVAALVFVVALAGVARLSVENRFIDYFSPSTEIRQGMVVVDRELGGSTPLDLILDADPGYVARAAGGEGGGLSGSSYWFNTFRLDKVRRVQDYLDSLPEVGKVLSLATSMQLLRQLNGGEPLSNFMLAIVYERLPDDIKRRLFEPYMSRDGSQLRFAARIFETSRDLERGQLLRKIRSDVTRQLGIAPEQVHLTGMTVLYNNMLERLFRSQATTFGVVLLAIWVMFMVLFRSITLSAIALAPNLLVAAAVLGLMGWLHIPLDMMTITIASIALGIAVDDTIHYLHRFKAEFAQDGDYWAAARRCHDSIGRAIFYTSITITLGFSILALSDFVPTVYFGLLAGAAMTAALAADLTLLPALLATVKPFGTDAPEQDPMKSGRPGIARP